MTPLVSIIIPAYNAERWIAEALRSAVAQTWPRKEIIVIDDGSTDRTLKIARRFECDWITVVTQRNEGAAAARNTALSLRRGDYIQWLDADDILAPDKIAAQMKVVMASCRSNLTLFSSSWGRFLYRCDRAKFAPTPLWRDLSPLEWLLCRMEMNLYMQTATWLVSRELTEAAGPWDTRLLGDDDKEYFCRVLLACDSVRFVSDAKVYYRLTGPNSLSYIGRSTQRLEALWCSMQLHIRHILYLEDSERVRVACIKYLQTLLSYFYPERLDIVEQAERMAKSLGGRLAVPSLSWKYAWIKALFGWAPAKQAQLIFPRVRWGLARCWDETLFRLKGTA